MTDQGGSTLAETTPEIVTQKYVQNFRREMSRQRNHSGTQGVELRKDGLNWLWGTPPPLPVFQGGRYQIYTIHIRCQNYLMGEILNKLVHIYLKDFNILILNWILIIFGHVLQSLSHINLTHKLHTSIKLRSPWRWPTGGAETCRSNNLQNKNITQQVGNKYSAVITVLQVYCYYYYYYYYYY